ncbi:MAG TPA: hypothetical protein VIM53_00440 [Candidatus Saccharimonadales bacterium]
MDERNESQDKNIQTTSKEARQGHEALRRLLIWLLVITLIGAGAYSAYYWQHKKVISDSQKISSLNTQLSQQSKQSTSTKSSGSTSSTFTYTPKTGGLTITLPKAYEVLVGADGNDGGAPGASFKIVPVDNTNIANDGYFQDEIEIDIGNTFKSLDQSVTSAELEINPKSSPSDFTVTDTTIAGLPAKQIAQYQDEYDGTLDTYVVGSGVWEYKITAHVASYTNSPLPTNLLDALHGMAIKEVADE